MDALAAAHRQPPLWPLWRRFAVLGLLGGICYNALQYLALKTSTPLNVTLVAPSMQLWMLAFGACLRPAPLRLPAPPARCSRSRACWSCSAAATGNLLLQVRLVPSDFFVLLATAAWAPQLAVVKPGDPASIRGDWAAFVAARWCSGSAWSGLLRRRRVGASPQHIAWGGRWWPRWRTSRSGPRSSRTARGGWACNAWARHRGLLQQPHAVVRGGDVGRVPGRTPAGGTAPAVAFALIVGGILVSSRRSATGGKGRFPRMAASHC